MIYHAANARKVRAHHDLRAASIAAARGRAYPPAPQPRAESIETPEPSGNVERAPPRPTTRAFRPGSAWSGSGGSFAPRVKRRPKNAKGGCIVPDDRTDNECAYCGEPKRFMTFDHLVPLSAGGPNAWWNLCRACGDCNNAKGGAVFDFVKIDKSRIEVSVDWSALRAAVAALVVAVEEKRAARQTFAWSFGGGARPGTGFE